MKASNQKVILIGLGGCSSSGKSTIAKIANSLITNSVLIHQDDFFKHDNEIPINSKYNIQDWDTPDAIDFDLFKQELISIKKDGKIKTELIHNDNVEDPFKKFSLPYGFINSISSKFNKIIEAQQTTSKCELKIVIVEGFMLYNDPNIAKLFDISLLVRSSYNTLKERRAGRPGYQTLDSYWVDPPYYFDEFVYKSYADTHSYLFINSDVESGMLKPEFKDTIFLFDNNNDTKIEDAVSWIFDAVAKSLN
ncbi:hypothetical protein TPHA_0I01410 [Tetrapisispora phaffii CBS 4417]|uniref:Phosphoribulokinase/uridine kinase domain-containing protein n=1 Tax=Tetrapisispora phaffii (strain ATCC 24235 / CBS 4417 / NBRC 1672 / NRRL Y-8282 / UCD 70-5) TaxID=1071381 RepID=G8BXL9_TETPH|nr:hypothetical protein TPHA_0I01410 [Tetrapisispora phaffii CBS 4417]CCE64647.1 hypothetical protein TPHA_0I01410 [Tetrapisispora phaffii CBS 4417]